MHQPYFADEDGVTTSNSLDKYLWISIHFRNPITTKLTWIVNQHAPT